jgi:hypothetical protein
MPEVFQYGSNLSKDRFTSRMLQGEYRPVSDLGRYDLNGCEVVFDVPSQTVRVAADMIPSQPSSRAVGRVWGITKKQFETLKGFEGPRYREERIQIPGVGNAITFVGTDDARRIFRAQHSGELPTGEYLHHIITGLNDPNVRAEIEYISQIIGKGRPNLSGSRRDVRQTFDNPREFMTSSIGIDRNLRDDLGVGVGDFVRVHYDRNWLNLQVRKAPIELVDSTLSPVTLSRKAREFLGMRPVSQRDAESFRTIYPGLSITRLENL